MKSTGKRILAALWVAGALAGLLAVVFLPGSWDSGGGPAEAHTDLDVEWLDTAALCDAHNVDADGDACTAGNPDASADAFPAVDVDDDGDFNDEGGSSGFLNYDSDGDGDDDTLLVKLGAADIAIRAAIHVHDGADDDGDGTAVGLSVSGSKDVITGVSRDSDAGGALDNAGLLTVVTATDAVVADTVSDVDAVTAGQCNNVADTCIDSDKGGNPDGIAIVEFTCESNTDFTVTASVNFGPGIDRSDDLHVICAEKGALSVNGVHGLTEDPLAAQSVIAQDGDAEAAGGDPNLDIAVSVVDLSGSANPVINQNVDCEINEADDDQADIIPGAYGGTAAGVNQVNDLPDVSPGVKGLVLQNEANNAKGTVKVTCWVDNDPEDDLQDTDEISGSAVFTIAGPPSSIDFAGGTALKMNAFDTESLAVDVTDNTGQTVADHTECQFSFADPGAVALLVPLTVLDTEGGMIKATLGAADAGNLLVLVECGDLPGDVMASRILPVQVNSADLPEPEVPTVTGTPPTETPTATPTATPLPPFSQGDANCDGSVDANDALLILQLDAGLITELPC